MLKGQSFFTSKFGSKFWWLPWFPAVFYPGQTFCTRVYLSCHCVCAQATVAIVYQYFNFTLDCNGSYSAIQFNIQIRFICSMGCDLQMAQTCSWIDLPSRLMIGKYLKHWWISPNTVFPQIVDATTILFWRLWVRQLFKGDNYSKEETINSFLFGWCT